MITPTITPETEQELRDYGNRLHPAQRGIFIKYANAPRWKKKLIQSTYSRFWGNIPTGSTPTAQDLIDLLFDAEEELAKEKEDINKSTAKSFLSTLWRVLTAPILAAMYAPILSDILPQAVRWGANRDVETYLYAGILGSFVDGIKPKK